MKWEKKGLLVRPSPHSPWGVKYCMCPTPEVRGSTIRIYFGTTDADVFGNVGYVDVDARDPSRVLARSESPLLSPGEEGAFDDCGAIPGSIVSWRGKLLLYYMGFQRAFKVPYMIFTGLAVSTDGGETFRRELTVPVLDRTSDSLTLRSGPTVMSDQGRLRMWYNASLGWLRLANGKLVPKYVIRYAESDDGIHWRDFPGTCIGETFEEGVTAYSRPWVIRTGNLLRMWFSIRSRISPDAIAYHRLGYAESVDGLAWTRKDAAVGLARSAEGWDSEMICYPSVVSAGENYWLFYNGNNNGIDGFGYAKPAFDIGPFGAGREESGA